MKLSICITTLNRALYIGATLESILVQLTDDCEVVVLDGASTDETERVVSEYTRRFDRLRYVKQATNNGVDRDYDRVVELAVGEYCWLMTDDDLLKPGAIATVLQALHRDLSLVIVTAEIRDLNMSKVVQRRWPNFESDRVYAPDEMDRLFVEVDGTLLINAYVIKREIWLGRERERYYGSLHIYMGVIFQEHLPGDTVVIAEPLISHRWDNVHEYGPQVGEILWVKWPSLAESLILSESAKEKVSSVRPWRHLGELLMRRAIGYYSLVEYRRWIRPRLRSSREAVIPILVALLPGTLLNAAFVLYYSYYSVTRRPFRGRLHPEAMLYFVRKSRFHFRNWRVFKHKPYRAVVRAAVKARVQ